MRVISRPTFLRKESELSMASEKLRMQAPKGCTGANIEGHSYEVPKDGKITVLNGTHVETLKRHGFTEIVEENPEQLEAAIVAMDDKDELVEFIEERGGEADNDMGLKKLRRLAREAAGIDKD